MSSANRNDKGEKVESTSKRDDNADIVKVRRYDTQEEPAEVSLRQISFCMGILLKQASHRRYMAFCR
jgi:hypothetical protein